MINKNNEYSTTAVSSHETNPTVSSPISLTNSVDRDQNANNEQNNGFIENKCQEDQLQETEGQHEDNDDDDEFIRITAAHQMLTEGKQTDENTFVLLFQRTGGDN